MVFFLGQLLISKYIAFVPKIGRHETIYTIGTIIQKMGFDTLVTFYQKRAIVVAARLDKLISSIIFADKKAVDAIFIMFKITSGIFYIFARTGDKRQINILTGEAIICVFTARPIPFVVV